MMFCVDSRFEIHIPSFFAEEGSTQQQFYLVEQCFNVPLWHIQVLPRVTGEDGFQRWSCYLALRARDALAVLLGQHWESTKLHVVLPPYMTHTNSIAMVRCTALWDCRVNGQSDKPALLFDTATDSFVDPEFEMLSVNSVERLTCRWLDPEISGAGATGVSTGLVRTASQ